MQQLPSISRYQLKDQHDHHFCYFQIRNQATLIAQGCLLLFSFVIFILALKKYRQIWKVIYHRNKNANLTYLGIMIWFISYVAKGMYGVLIYIIYSGRSDSVTDELSWFSKLYFSLDWTNAFILQTLIIFVPYHWMKQISEALSSVQGESDTGSGLDIDLLTSYNGIQSKLYPLIKQYLRIRVFAVIPIALFLLLTDFQTVSLISKIMLSILVADCLVIVVILSMGIYSLKTNQLLKMQLDDEQTSSLNNRYIIIITCTLLRLVYDSFVLIYGASEGLTQDDCELHKSISWIGVSILVFTTALAHYLPVLIILRIYTIEDKPQDITKSLIVAE